MMLIPETVLMWSAAIILAAIALAAVVAAAVHGYLMRYRVRGLTRAQIVACRNLAADFRRYNGTNNGPVSPPVDPISVPRNHPNKETTDD